MAKSTGKIVQIQGGVVDCEFPEDQLPEIYEAVELPQPKGEPLILEVQKHLGNNWVRCVSMDTTDGLRRGDAAVATGSPIMVPVGPNTLGRIFSVLGRPIDEKGPVKSELQYSIHRAAPKFEEQATRMEILETGIKAIDIIAPFTKGGKTGIFGEGG